MHDIVAEKASISNGMKEKFYWNNKNLCLLSARRNYAPQSDGFHRNISKWSYSDDTETKEPENGMEWILCARVKWQWKLNLFWISLIFLSLFFYVDPWAIGGERTLTWMTFRKEPNCVIDSVERRKKTLWIHFDSWLFVLGAFVRLTVKGKWRTARAESKLKEMK